ncbi:Holliday junction branch migration protein RuvA [Brevibacillus daliensis]|uniref:Holliday junction branch migration protein RuvA n=1 Tax=Brevibacillus daliensis TaxID=2892995 RepID=UPI001E4AA04F|nr:Holliday junction branch migration protein RuvA [Brevibacillus daliensis]
MIDFVEGIISYIDTDCVVVHAGGLGYRVFCPNPYFYVKDEGKSARLYTHHHVREDAMHLYGFPSRDERDLYRRLLDVNGIGPKGALAILAGATPEQIVTAVQQENVNYLTKFPGIGKKTAQRMILDLKDKLKDFTPSMVVTNAPTSLLNDGLTYQNALEEALQALMALGYSDNETQSIRPQLLTTSKSGAGVEQLIKQGLALLMRG